MQVQIKHPRITNNLHWTKQPAITCIQPAKDFVNMKQISKFSITSRHNSYAVLTRMLDILLIPAVLFVIVKLNCFHWADRYGWWLLITMMTFQNSVELKNLHKPVGNVLPFPEVFAVTLPWALGITLLLAADKLTPLIPQDVQSCFWLWVICTPVTILLWHTVLANILNLILAKKAARRIAIVGATESGYRLRDTINEKKAIQGKFVGFFDDNGDRSQITDKKDLAGDLEKLVENTRNGQVDEIYITLPLRAEPKIKELIEQLSNFTASVYYIPDLFSFNLLRPTLYSIDGLPVLSIYDSPFTGGVESLLKRFLDIVASSLILLLISIPLVLIAVAVKATSKGPVLFKQRRYGLEGDEIVVWKFRSMMVCEDGDKVTQAKKNDSRLTKIGAFLRKYSLDELPQFINVLQGRMAIVGPRPHAVAHNEWYRDKIEGYMLRHKVKPGITGLAQISGYRGETDTMDKMEGRVYYDLLYIQNWSIWLDIKIILLTPYKTFFKADAY
jgi:putative colanic acid biosysnthesis UDP-glucose lipid carrier transferase